MELPPHDAIYVEEYCRLVGFFALSSDEQRTLVPTVTEPVYLAFNDGDGIYTRPLAILFNSLRDAVSHVAFHHGEDGYSFVSESLNEALSNKIYAIYYAQLWQPPTVVQLERENLLFLSPDIGR
jgi:hypothetical protein